MIDFSNLPPDWGGDTLARFRYQAEVAVPYCLAAALGIEGIQAVIPEFVDDLALQCDSGWRFLQVKSRNPELGLWTLSQLLQKHGALRGLYRTHLCAGDEAHTLELILEGAPNSRDLIMQLRSDGDKIDLIEPVASSLQITSVEAERFLNRVILDSAPPPRSAIAATNRDLIHTHSPGLDREQVFQLHQDLVAEIERAMRADRLGALWPRAVVHPNHRSAESQERLEAKLLDAERLAAFLPGLSPQPRPILRRLVDAGADHVSALERKMLEGGATPEIIEAARNLQANARHRRFERQAQGGGLNIEVLDDLHQRIEVHVATKTALYASDSTPAVRIWADLVQLFEDRVESIDRSGIFDGDPFLLLGEACSLSDQCRFGWGRSPDAG